MTILVTGYGPFLDIKVNPSQLVAEKLGKMQFGRHNVETLICPVDRHGASKPSDLVRNRPFRLVVQLGVDASATRVYFETCAFNQQVVERPKATGVRLLVQKLVQKLKKSMLWIRSFVFRKRQGSDSGPRG